MGVGFKTDSEGAEVWYTLKSGETDRLRHQQNNWKLNSKPHTYGRSMQLTSIDQP